MAESTTYKNDYRQKKVEINGKEYIFQSVPIRTALEMRAAWTRPDSTCDDIIMSELLLKNVIVSPKMKLDDFENIAELDSVISSALLFAFYSKTDEDVTLGEAKN